MNVTFLRLSCAEAGFSSRRATLATDWTKHAGTNAGRPVHIKPPSRLKCAVVSKILLMLAGCGLWVSVVLTLCGAEVGLVDGPGIVVDLADAHAPLIALDLRQPVRELHLLGVFYLHSVP